MGLLELCEKYFESNNLYEIIGVNKDASDKEVKKAYHKLSLKVHPDRVKEDQKLEATEKFKVLGAIHSILSDGNKRAVYDDTGKVDDDDNFFNEDKDWDVYWRILFKKITDDDIKKYEKEYIGSQEEKDDLRKAYLAGKGDMDYIVDHVQFARSEQEPRLREIVKGMIENGDIPSYKIFTHEPERKRKKRHAKENREAAEADEWKKEIGLGDSSDLALMIQERQQNRAATMDKFIDGLAAKYGGTGSQGKGTKRKATNKSETGKKRRTRN